MIETLRHPAWLLRVRHATSLLHESPELSEVDFGAPHPESAPDSYWPRLALGRFAPRSRFGSAFDAGGPLLFHRRAAHHEFARRDVDQFKVNAVPKVQILGVSLFRLSGEGRADGKRQKERDRTQQCAQGSNWFLRILHL